MPETYHIINIQNFIYVASAALWNHAVLKCHPRVIYLILFIALSYSLNSSHDINVAEDSATKGVKFMKINVRKKNHPDSKTIPERQ